MTSDARLRHRLLATTLLAPLLLADGALAAPSDAARLDALEQALAAQARQIEEQRRLIEQQQQQIQDLKRSASAPAAAEARPVRNDGAKVAFSGARPTFTSGDGDFSLALRGVVQFDSAHYAQKSPGGAVDFRRAATGSDSAEAARARDLNSGSNFRRVRLGAEGTLFRDWAYALIFEYGGSGQEDGGRINDVWIGYNGFKPFRFQIGALSPPAGLDDATSATETLFLERATPADLARSLAGSDGRYAAGVRANGDTWTASGFLTGGLINTPRDASAAFPAVASDEQLNVVGRATYLPYRTKEALVHVGAAASWVFQPPQVGDPSAPATGSRSPLRLRDRPELRVDGTRHVDTGNINIDQAAVYSAELAGQWRNIYAQGEYFHFDLDRKNRGGPRLADPAFHGWYVQASYVLTGERKSYSTANGAFGLPRPDQPFNPSRRQWGAWELALRYSSTDLDSHENSGVTAERVRGGEQKIWTAGLNWYPDSNLRVLLNYQWVDIDRLNPGGYAGALALPTADTPIGQSFQAVSLRAQLAF